MVTFLEWIVRVLKMAKRNLQTCSTMRLEEHRWPLNFYSKLLQSSHQPRHPRELAARSRRLPNDHKRVRRAQGVVSAQVAIPMS